MKDATVTTLHFRTPFSKCRNEDAEVQQKMRPGVRESSLSIGEEATNHRTGANLRGYPTTRHEGKMTAKFRAALAVSSLMVSLFCHIQLRLVSLCFVEAVWKYDDLHSLSSE